MLKLYKKIRDSWIYSILFSCLLLAIFLLFFYIANTDIFSKRNEPYEKRPAAFDVSNEELKKRIGSTNVSGLIYEEWVVRNNLGNNGKLDDDPDKDGLPNYLEYIHLTNPLDADTDKDKFSDKQEITNGYDPDAFGDVKPIVEIAISKMNITAPMVWSQSDDENSQLEDLKRGVSHFYKTASPGQTGNVVISGHSSNYVWVAGDYNYIFKDLNNLEKGDVIDMKTVQKNGRVITYHYKVTDKFSSSPEDERIFASDDKSILTLSTCWPLGTNFRRLIVKAELVK